MPARPLLALDREPSAPAKAAAAMPRHFLKLRLRDEINDEEEAALASAIGDIIDLPVGTTFVHRGEELGYSTILVEGLLARYKDLADGARQITHIHVPGDFADLHSFTLKHLDHSVMSLTACRIARVPHDRLTRITELYPHLTRVLWFSTNLDACIHREWEVSLGRRSAIARTAHLFCELQLRLEVVGLVDGNSYSFNLTQIELAECLGLTSVHVNRVLKMLRERGLVEFRGGRVTIHDLEGLREVAEFDPSYLYLEVRDR